MERAIFNTSPKLKELPVGTRNTGQDSGKMTGTVEAVDEVAASIQNMDVNKSQLLKLGQPSIVEAKKVEVVDVTMPVDDYRQV